MKKNNVLMENVLKSKKDIQLFEKSCKEMEKALELLPSQEKIKDREAIQLGEEELFSHMVIEKINKTEEACKHLQRYTQILQDLIRD